MALRSGDKCYGRCETFDSLLIRAFHYWGFIVHRWRWPLLIAPFLLTLWLSFGMLWLREQTTIDPQFVFSPENAEWRYERQVLTEHWPLDERRFWPGKSYDYSGYVDVIAAGRRTKNGGEKDKGRGLRGEERPNLLQSRYLNELERVNSHIINNLTVPWTHDGKVYQIGFTDLCMSHDHKCYSNDHLTMLQPRHKWVGDLSHLAGATREELADFAKSIIESEVNITYPIGWRGTEPIYFAALVGGVDLSDGQGHFDYVRAVRLTYNVRDGAVGNVSYAWRKAVAAYLSDKRRPASDILEFGLYHNESLPEGLQQVDDALKPKFAITATTLFLFCLGCSLVLLTDSAAAATSKRSSGRVVGVDWLRSKPILGIAALVCPVLAVISAFGLLQWLGTLYNAIVDVSPFIVLSVGIDDAFIMNAAWHRTNPQLSVPTRLAESLAEAAVAISITSWTDMLTFGVGCITTLPGVRLFCAYTFWGIAFAYLYQITYFAAVMAFAGEMEDKGKHACFPFVRTLSGEAQTTIFSRVKLFLMAGTPSRKELMLSANGGDKAHDNSTGEKESHADGSDVMNDYTASAMNTSMDRKGQEQLPASASVTSFSWLRSSPHHADALQEAHHCRETLVNRLFRDWYGPALLTNAKVKAVVGAAYLCYVSASLYGISQIKEGLDPKNLVLSDFYLADFYRLIDESFWREGLQIQVVVNRPPDLFDPQQRQRVARMVADFEETPYTMAHNATMLWLDAYEAKLAKDAGGEQIGNTTHGRIPLPKTSAEWYHRCKEWLLTAGGRRLWELDMHWSKTAERWRNLGGGIGQWQSRTDDKSKESKNEEEEPAYKALKAFRFQVGLRNYRTPEDHMHSCKMMREVAARYPDLNVTTFHEYYPFADQYLELRPALYRNCLLAVVCVMAISWLMIPDAKAAFAIVAAILSIDIGVAGFMAFWGVQLEAVSMITIIMSIGFSVDLSAHISYAYVKSGGSKDGQRPSANARAIASLETLGWPVFLGAFSTIAGIMALTLVDAYIVQIFFKTVFLVISFSLLHGIVFLPILLTLVVGEK